MTLDADGRLVVLNWRDLRHPSAGGAELYCERLARELAARGHEVVLVTSRPQGVAARERREGYAVRRMGGWLTVYPMALLWLLRHRRSVRAVVDSQNGIPFFSPLVTARRTPVLLLVHHVHQDLFTQALHPFAARLARWLEGPVSRRVYRRRTVVVLSPSARAEVRRRLRFDGHISVVPCGAEASTVERARTPAPRVVVVGRLTRYKELGSLIDAVADVQAVRPDVELHLVGDGAHRAALEQRARTAGADVVFHGRLSDARRDDLLRGAWLTVSTSAGGDWATSLVEANAAGVPALARRVRGVRDAVVHGETGWLVDIAREPLAEMLRRALTTLEDPAVADRMAERSRAWAAGFTWSRTADGVLQALRSERARLDRAPRRSAERRTANDLAVVLDLPESALVEGWEGTQRAGDVWVADGTRVRGLLSGADEVDVLAVLHRLGVDPADPSVRVLVARHADHLGARTLAPQAAVELVQAVSEQATEVALEPVLAATGTSTARQDQHERDPSAA